MELIGLNEKQKQAVKTTEGYVRVIAGAGSGKTKALTYRFAYLVNELGISPDNILCVTFTNKAAQEMRKRISSLTNQGNVNDFICTYHGFCLKFLKEEINKMHFSREFIILDEEDSKLMLKEVYGELGMTADDMTYKDALSLIVDTKHDTPYVKYFIPKTRDEYFKEYISGNTLSDRLIKTYFDKQIKLVAFDFTDMLAFTIHIMGNYKDVSDKWQDRMHYIMTDEAQDNSGGQWLIADMFSGKHKNLFIVGDPDQSIYGWRGANVGLFLGFNESHKPCTDIVMDENYRSTPNILNVANSVICHNKERIDKNLFTKNNEGEAVIHYHGKNEIEEGDYVCNSIKKLIENGAKPSQFSILYRSSSISRYIEQALVRNGISYTIYGGTRFFERKEIKDALSYLRLIAFEDDLSFKRIINTPSRKLGAVYVKGVVECANNENKSFYETLKSHINEPQFNKESAVKFVELIEECKAYSEMFSISDLLEYVLKESGLKDLLRISGDQDRIDNIDELMRSISLYEHSNVEEGDLSFVKYLQDIALYTNLDYKENKDNVKLMTIHQSKGLEFPYVFVCGMNEGSFPSIRTIRQNKNKGLEEERRLAYVALTRAERALFMTESEGWNTVTNNFKFPSRFIGEIKKGLYVVDGIIPADIIDGAKRFISQSDEDMEWAGNGDVLKIGSHIAHGVFGLGTIVYVDVKAFKYIVNFERVGEKPISFNFVYTHPECLQ